MSTFQKNPTLDKFILLVHEKEGGKRGRVVNEDVGVGLEREGAVQLVFVPNKKGSQRTQGRRCVSKDSSYLGWELK